MASVKEIDALLPQTQCGECSYPGCRPYAEALAAGTAEINRCPPGGVDVVRALGELLHVDSAPYLVEAKNNTRLPAVAIIREEECIGCTKCIQACPVDAIIGSAKHMHSILESECTGCGLCIEPCPVDCIDLVLLPSSEPKYDKDLARKRYEARKVRLLSYEQARQKLYQEKRNLSLDTEDKQKELRAKQDYIQQALMRALAKKHE